MKIILYVAACCTIEYFFFGGATATSVFCGICLGLLF
jgi:hypothetical protein